MCEQGIARKRAPAFHSQVVAFRLYTFVLDPTGTQRGYLVAVKNFTTFLGRCPDQADTEDLRRYQLHMRSSGASATSMNAAVSALRFFFGVTLERGDANVGMATVREPRRLPVVLSPEEVVHVT